MATNPEPIFHFSLIFPFFRSVFLFDPSLLFRVAQRARVESCQCLHLIIDHSRHRHWTRLGELPAAFMYSSCFLVRLHSASFDYLFLRGRLGGFCGRVQARGLRSLIIWVADASLGDASMTRAYTFPLLSQSDLRKHWGFEVAMHKVCVCSASLYRWITIIQSTHGMAWPLTHLSSSFLFRRSLSYLHLDHD